MDAIDNEPSLWRADLPRPATDGHKYGRGSALIIGAPELTGATRLAAEACSRVGSGLVAVLAEARGDVYRSSLAADIMVRDELAGPHEKVTALLVGPGGLPPSWRTAVSGIGPDVGLVIDADGLVVLSSLAELPNPRILTPHEGEFVRTFPALTGTRAERCLAASAAAASVVVLKGPETLIAEGDRLVVNRHASPYLAKAGSGDVLAGLVTGLLAQQMEPFEAACAAVWIHGEAARRVGPGLIPNDLIEQTPAVLRELLS